jgi:hypothetical protein
MAGRAAPSVSIRPLTWPAAARHPVLLRGFFGPGPAVLGLRTNY